jgi:hypothetical protein
MDGTEQCKKINKDQQGKGNVHMTQPPDTPKQGTQKASCPSRPLAPA